MYITARLLLTSFLLIFALGLLCSAALAYGQGAHADVIAYVRESYRESDIYMIDLQTGIDIPLVNRQVRDYRPVWSPDGTKLAFVRAGFGSTLFITNADGSNLRRMSPGDTGIITMESGVLQPGWTADGQQIVFVYQMPQTQSIHRYEFMMINVDDGDIFLADEEYPAVRDYLRTFRRTSLTSPDQGMVLRIQQEAGHYGLMTQGVTDETTHLIHRFEGSNIFLSGSWSWSPDGSHIAFSMSEPGRRTVRTYIVRADGTGLRLLTEGEIVHSPAWRP